MLEEQLVWSLAIVGGGVNHSTATNNNDLQVEQDLQRKEKALVDRMSSISLR